MANWYLNDEYKIRLNLSSLALSIIEQDKITFSAKSRTQFLNRVFLHAHTRSEASICRQMDYLQEQYMSTLDGLKLPANTLQEIVNRLLQSQEAELIARHTGYACAHEAISHNLTDEVADALMAATGESKYYTPAQYFKAVIEDYCRQSTPERETIYFADFFATINNAIDSELQLDICNRNKVRYLVHPYRLLIDPRGSYHYLVCYARSKNQPISTKSPYSFRINQLSAVHSTGNRAFLSEQECKDMDDAVSTRGVQFLMQPCKPIKVQLTPKGVRLLNRYATMRPLQIGKPEGDIYTFQCTEIQAEYYFLKLGDEAKILEPANLKKRFARLYTRAAAVYTSAEHSEKRNGNSPKTSTNAPNQE